MVLEGGKGKVHIWDDIKKVLEMFFFSFFFGMDF